MTSFAESPSENAPMITFDGQERQADLSGL